MFTPSHPTIAAFALHQLYTAPFLARLATFILQAPLPTVKSAFGYGDIASDSTSDGDGYSDFASLLASIDPNTDAL